MVPPSAVELQRGHAFSGVETEGKAASGALPYQLQRGHAFSGVETVIRTSIARRGSTRFKGATPSQAWRRSQERARPAGHALASKGPRLLRRGDRVSNETRSLTLSALQRGHAFSGVETSPTQTWSLGHICASKGPRLLRRGDHVASARPSVCLTGFKGATPSQAWRPS